MTGSASSKEVYPETLANKHCLGYTDHLHIQIIWRNADNISVSTH